MPHRNVDISRDMEASAILRGKVFDHDFRVLENTPWVKNVIMETGKALKS